MKYWLNYSDSDAGNKPFIDSDPLLHTLTTCRSGLTRTSSAYGVSMRIDPPIRANGVHETFAPLIGVSFVDDTNNGEQVVDSGARDTTAQGKPETFALTFPPRVPVPIE